MTLIQPISDPRWYLIHTKPRQEARALENLERQGFECFRPLRPVERCRNGRTYTASEALFPDYLFIRLDRLSDNWFPISSTRGVHQIVRFHDYPLPVGDDLIESIRDRISGVTTPRPYFQPGERVRITQGAFSDAEGIFLATDGQERVVLLLRILQMEQPLIFPLKEVRKVV